MLYGIAQTLVLCALVIELFVLCVRLTYQVLRRGLRRYV